MTSQEQKKKETKYIGVLPKLIGLAGYSGSGKDTVADGIIRCTKDLRPCKRYAFADPMRDIVRIFHGPIEVFRRVHPERYRVVMQTIGAYGRSNFGQDFWVQQLARRLQSVHGGSDKYGVIISDVRYPNELAWIRSMGGELWFVEGREDNKLNEHESEQHYEYLRSQADWIIDNSGTLDDLESILLTLRY